MSEIIVEKQSKSVLGGSRKPLITQTSKEPNSLDPNTLLSLPPPRKPANTHQHNGFQDDNDDNVSMFSKVSHSVISTKMRDGKKKINQYIVMKEIGKGAFGKVKLVLNTEENNKQYAMKTVAKENNKIKGFLKGKGTVNITDVMQEIAIMKKLVSTSSKLSSIESCKRGAAL